MNFSSLHPIKKRKEQKIMMKDNIKMVHKHQFIFTNDRELVEIDGQVIYIPPNQVFEFSKKYYLTTTGKSGQYIAHYTYFIPFEIGPPPPNTNMKDGKSLIKVRQVDPLKRLVFLPQMVSILFKHFHELQEVSQLAIELIRVVKN